MVRSWLRSTVLRLNLAIRSYFSGHANKDTAYYHKASKTVIAADLLFNLPGTEQVRHCKSGCIDLADMEIARSSRSLPSLPSPSCSGA